MQEGKVCPKCGELCFQEAFVPNIVFGYRCKNCGNEFNVMKIVVGWDETDVTKIIHKNKDKGRIY